MSSGIFRGGTFQTVGTSSTAGLRGGRFSILPQGNRFGHRTRMSSMSTTWWLFAISLTRLIQWLPNFKGRKFRIPGSLLCLYISESRLMAPVKSKQNSVNEEHEKKFWGDASYKNSGVRAVGALPSIYYTTFMINFFKRLYSSYTSSLAIKKFGLNHQFEQEKLLGWWQWLTESGKIPNTEASVF